MSLKVESLALANWRSIEGLSLALDPSLTMLVGPNATGKTNTVEALALLTRGTSFRRAKAAEQVREGAEAGSAKARLAGDGRVVDVGVSVSLGEGRRFTRNGKPVSPSSVAGTLLSVLFTPDDLTLVKGSGRERRGEMDAFGSQASRAYGKVARTYQRSVEQRNRLLKEPVVDESLLAAWDESVALGGATLLSHRLSLMARMGPLWEEAYRRIAGGEELRVSYASSLGELGGAETRAQLAERMARAFAERREEELSRGHTVVGPHRDDLLLEVAGRDARSFASQGQQRSIVLAWKLAQVRFAEDVLGERPILLLDDVMSELDDHRRAAIASLVDAGIQTVITTTHTGYFDAPTLERAKVVPYG